jgi:hypothetical protein
MKKRGICMCAGCGWDYLYRGNGVLKIFSTDSGKRKTLCNDCYDRYMEKEIRNKRKHGKESSRSMFVNG